MDKFKQLQMKDIGPGGASCPCCNRSFGKKRRELNGRARARIRELDGRVLRDLPWGWEDEEL